MTSTLHGSEFKTSWVRAATAVLCTSALLTAALAIPAAAQTAQDIAVRNQLIANQEALLNTYRCMFSIDTQIVPGGCSTGNPAQPAKGPDEFTGDPTDTDITVRDQLIADQEALLNTYRCMFSIDTQIVPGGCSTGAGSGGEDLSDTVQGEGSGGEPGSGEEPECDPAVHGNCDTVFDESDEPGVGTGRMG